MHKPVVPAYAEAAAKQFEHQVELMMHARQAAAAGLGEVAQNGPASFALPISQPPDKRAR